MVTEVLPFIIPIVLIITIGVVIIVTRAIEYREKVEMLKHGYVPKGYQPAQRNGAAQTPGQSEQPAALPPAPWGAQQWQESVQTSRYPGELAKDDSGIR